MATIGDHITSRDNNCDLVRLVAAWMVLLSHSWAFMGRVTEEPAGRLFGRDSFGSIAVAIFFVLSGLLVTASYCSDTNPVRYLLRRSLRIYPALFWNTLFSILVIGCIATALPLRQYLFSSRTWTYMANALAWRHVYDLPGVFKHLPVPETVNGSLWTLRSELNMYVILLALGMLRILRPAVVIALLAAAVATTFIPTVPDRQLLGVPIEQCLWHAYYFFSGTLFFLYRARIRLNWWLFAACLAIVALTAGRPTGTYCLRLSIPYIVICLSLRSSAAARWLHTRIGDLSYGTYLYAFPIQQLIMYLIGPRLSLPVFIAISTVTTFAIANLSWHLVEKPAMKLKPRSKKQQRGDTPPSTTPEPATAAPAERP